MQQESSRFVVAAQHTLIFLSLTKDSTIPGITLLNYIQVDHFEISKLDVITIVLSRINKIVVMN